MKKLLLIIIFLSLDLLGQTKNEFKIGRLKYGGGGDWYNDPSAEINLINFLNQTTNIKAKPVYTAVDIASDEIFNFPFLFMTGHGNVVFSDSEIDRLKSYLNSGGFLYIDDDYGMDKAIRRELKKLFPDKELQEVPYNHKIYNIMFDFTSGPPKTHKHDEKPPEGLGIFLGERLAIFYTYESNPSDGWADAEVHNDPQEKREEALKFGANIVLYALSN